MDQKSVHKSIRLFSFMHAPPETQVQLDRPLSTEHGRKKKEENPTKVEQIFRTRA